MKPSIPRGTRDFGPAEMQKRNYILSILRNNFELFGYEPIETPSMENISTLTGKYGDEGDQLIFKILNSRIHESKNKDLLKKEFDLSLESSRNSEDLTEKALRYDLTVPFARFVVMNQHKLIFPFKRYQIQPVWRADRPQKGRYREFYQCDADVIGSNSLLNELDLIAMMDKSFSQLNIPVLLKFNNRKILTALAEVINEPSKIIDITVAIDKLDKIGKDGVNKELNEKGISAEAINKLQPLLDFKGSNNEKVEILRSLVGSTEIGKKGLEEIEFLLKNVSPNHAKIELDITLARGLNYYTGTIFEVKANAGTFTPSILGGGRYDDLTGIFGLPNMSGVGISFGVDRIYDVMEELNVFPESISNSSSTALLFTHFDEESQYYCIHLAKDLRDANISCEIYPDITKKLGKQIEYADKKNIPFVCTVGSNEITKGVYAIKKMSTGDKQELNITDLIHYLKTELA
ncbi:histidine--tRNA ligase [Aurantibacillus circumpalustris]|uniref:histidine--tRNA ligase n=1 Tax=Aurantibacillus circumpalustris TaxID=3036359 RepID=UPI00295B217B|nr:histidine--tRNA ligase [Aurantibacillus circumpalustris]